MKAIVCETYGPIEGLRYADVPDPVPGPREIVIGAEAIGVNFPDGLLVQGLYQSKPPTPFTPGMEVVGNVLSVGSEVKRFKPGDRVGAVSMLGAYAEQVKVHQNAAMPVPPGADAGQVTALMCGYGTAHHALKQRAQLQPGEMLAVTGAAGLTGLAAVQIGKAMGAKVIAAASSQEKVDFAKACGADVGIVYPEKLDEDDRAATKALSEAFKQAGGGGVDVIYDSVGGAYAEPALRAMNWDGRFLVIGFPAGIPKIPLNLTLLKSCQVMGVFWGAFTARDPKGNEANVAELFDLYTKGKIKPRISAHFPLSRGGEAIRHLADRKAQGKVVVTID